MQSPRSISGLSEIADRFGVIFCDVWGVIHNGREAFTEACHALTAFRAQGGVVVMVTNAPVPEARVLRVMDRLGVPATSHDRIATSGDATRRQLALHGGPVYAIGVEGDTSVYEGLDIELTDDAAKAAVICCTSLRDYPNDHPDRYVDEMRRLADTGLEMICANPDVQFRHGDDLIWSAGSLAVMFEGFGGTVIRPGKPDQAIYDLAREEALGVIGELPDPANILAIGDGPETDIRGAMNQGFASLFIGGGIHDHEFGEADNFIEDADRVLKGAGVQADYAAPVLSW